MGKIDKKKLSLGTNVLFKNNESGNLLGYICEIVEDGYVMQTAKSKCFITYNNIVMVELYDEKDDVPHHFVEVQ